MVKLQVNYRVAKGARGASCPDGASRGPSGAKPCKLQGVGPSDGSPTYTLETSGEGTITPKYEAYHNIYHPNNHPCCFKSLLAGSRRLGGRRQARSGWNLVRRRSRARPGPVRGSAVTERRLENCTRRQSQPRLKPAVAGAPAKHRPRHCHEASAPRSGPRPICLAMDKFPAGTLRWPTLARLLTLRRG